MTAHNPYHITPESLDLLAEQILVAVIDGARDPAGDRVNITPDYCKAPDAAKAALNMIFGGPEYWKPSIPWVL